MINTWKNVFATSVNKNHSVSIHNYFCQNRQRGLNRERGLTWNHYWLKLKSLDNLKAVFYKKILTVTCRFFNPSYSKGGGGGGVEQTSLMFFVNNFSWDKATETKFRLILHCKWTHKGECQFRGYSPKIGRGCKFGGTLGKLYKNATFLRFFGDSCTKRWMLYARKM